MRRNVLTIWAGIVCAPLCQGPLQDLQQYYRRGACAVSDCLNFGPNSLKAKPSRHNEV